MPEIGNISDCNDTRFHPRRFPFRGNSEWWALEMERVQIINPYRFIPSVKRNVSSSKTREEVKLSINHFSYCNFSYTFPRPVRVCPVMALGQAAEMDSERRLTGSWQLCASVAFLLEGCWPGDTWVLCLTWDLPPWSICAKHPHENFL